MQGLKPFSLDNNDCKRIKHKTHPNVSQTNHNKTYGMGYNLDGANCEERS